MGGLPTGTITLLFSDIEGSTMLLQRLGDQWAEALTAQRHILRSCFAAHDGHEMGTEGDSFFVVFSAAHDALAAALEGQARLQEHPWPGGVSLSVRMGLHTGEPQRLEDGYVGLDVHRAARIAATASGGQIVVSEAAALMMGDLAETILIRDLGWHRLKDLQGPERLFDVVDTRGQILEFPPLRSLGTGANLPRPTAKLIGRDTELADLMNLVRGDTTRLVTLTGPGGTGKTSLAVALAYGMEREFRDGVFFADLQAADRAALMWAGISDSLNASGEVEELPHKRVQRFLRQRRALLVLDNLEQIPDADQVVAGLLNETPDVSLVATSRRPLHLVAEHEHPVSPLSVPARGPVSLETARGSHAIDLFTQRAIMASPTFELSEGNVQDVAELCAFLDGLPLAIELAAARSRLLSPRAMLRRIDDRLGEGVTAADRTARQRSLGDTIAWSYDLLDPLDQQMFHRLSVFSGTCDLGALEWVAGHELDIFDAVARLADSSLIQIVDSRDGEPRVAMLQTIRSFARKRLDASGEADTIHLQHARWCTEVASAISELLHGPRQMSALDRMEGVEEDIRAALDWCLRYDADDRHERVECGLGLLAPMTAYWYRFGYVAEGRGWLERAVEVAGGVKSRGVVDALHGVGIMMLQQNDVVSATGALERALEMASSLNDPDIESRECNSLGVAHREAGNLVEAERLIDRSLTLAREIGSTQREATALSNKVTVLLDAGDYAAGVSAADEAIGADTALNDPWGVAVDNTNKALALLRAEGPEQARDHLVTVALDVIALEDIELSIGIVELFACTMAELGSATLAAELVGTADVQRDKAGMPRSIPDAGHLNRSILPVKSRTPATEWASAYQRGTARAIADAVEVALEERRPIA